MGVSARGRRLRFSKPTAWQKLPFVVLRYNFDFIEITQDDSQGTHSQRSRNPKGAVGLSALHGSMLQSLTRSHLPLLSFRPKRRNLNFHNRFLDSAISARNDKLEMLRWPRNSQSGHPHYEMAARTGRRSEAQRNGLARSGREVVKGRMRIPSLDLFVLFCQEKRTHFKTLRRLLRPLSSQ